MYIVYIFWFVDEQCKSNSENRRADFSSSPQTDRRTRIQVCFQFPTKFKVPNTVAVNHQSPLYMRARYTWLFSTLHPTVNYSPHKLHCYVCGYCHWLSLDFWQERGHPIAYRSFHSSINILLASPLSTTPLSTIASSLITSSIHHHVWKDSFHALRILLHFFCARWQLASANFTYSISSFFFPNVKCSMCLPACVAF